MPVQFNYQNLKHDIPSGLVVSLVALPLCLGIALASGAPLISGLVAGIIGGLVVALISGSAVSVSGPAAGLSVIVLDAIHTLGTFEAVAIAVLISGVLQLIFSSMHLGFIADYIPMSVIQGMLSAIGLVIIFKQIPHALGRDKDFEGSLSFFGTSGDSNTFHDIYSAISSYSLTALCISISCLLIIGYWETLTSKISKIISKIPATLVAIIAGTAINELLGIYYPELKLKVEGEHLVNVGNPNDSLFSKVLAPDYKALYNLTTWKIGLLIAVVGSVETLLSIEAADKLDKHHRISNPNQELLAQGVGNIISGIFCGLPITSVVVRTTANIYAGARSRYSAFFHGLFLLLSVMFVPALLNKIPLSALAAILIMVGYKLINLKVLMRMWALGYYQFIPFIFTIIAIMFTDLLTGVALGLTLGLFFVLRETHHAAFTVVNQEDLYLIRFNKDVSFLNKSELKDKLAKIPARSHLILDGTKAICIDNDIKDVLRDFRKNAKYKEISLEYRHMHF